MNNKENAVNHEIKLIIHQSGGMVEVNKLFQFIFRRD